jgi:hypothetical protein
VHKPKESGVLMSHSEKKHQNFMPIQIQQLQLKMPIVCIITDQLQVLYGSPQSRHCQYVANFGQGVGSLLLIFFEVQEFVQILDQIGLIETEIFSFDGDHYTVAFKHIFDASKLGKKMKCNNM